MHFTPPRRLWWIVLSFAALSFTTSGQSLHFTKEVINISLSDSSAVVRGRYWFENDGTGILRQALYYPFAADSLAIDSVTVDGDCCANRWNRTRSGLSIPLELQSGATGVVTVSYRESAPGRKLRYILTSTAAWGRPLRKARYDVFVPHDFFLDDLSMGPPAPVSVSGGMVYSVERAMFSPDRDLTVRWGRRVH